jgi:hypothetical protein
VATASSSSRAADAAHGISGHWTGAGMNSKGQYSPAGGADCY